MLRAYESVLGDHAEGCSLLVPVGYGDRTERIVNHAAYTSRPSQQMPSGLISLVDMEFVRPSSSLKTESHNVTHTWFRVRGGISRSALPSWPSILDRTTFKSSSSSLSLHGAGQSTI